MSSGQLAQSCAVHASCACRRQVVDHIWSSAAVLGRWVVHGTRAVEGGWVMLDVAAPAIRPV